MRIASCFAVAALAFTSVAGCTSSGNAAAQSPFDGDWSCTQTDALTYSSPPGSAPESSTNPASLVVTEEVNGAFTATSSTEAGASCPLHYTASGSNATLIASQSCVSGALTFAYTEGTLAVSGSSMNATLQFTFTGSVNDVTVAGTGTTTFTCKNGA